jgi:UDP-N-acetylglucosamine enolpyruvyl transferase
LMSQAKWISKIHEVLFEWRLNILIELEKMWANVAILNSHEALIFWPNTLRWATTVDSWDLRAWAAMIIASLIRDWETKITNINYIYRWYENFVGKLQKLWADIREEKED